MIRSRTRHCRTACALLFALAAQGCATITSSELQSISVTTHTAGGLPLEKARCTLTNDRGSWQVDSPAVVSVRRSSEDLMVECKKPGQPDGLERAISRAAGGMFGNIIFGGGIGALIDHSKGTGYDYPDALAVRMGASVVVDRREAQDSRRDESLRGE